MCRTYCTKQKQCAQKTNSVRWPCNWYIIIRIMKNDVRITDLITIPEHELEISASRSGGAGGQHVNKTNTRVTVRWNVKTTAVLSPEQKERVLTKLQSHVTTDGDIIIHSSASRSQLQNKKSALAQLAQLVRTALYVAKKRMQSRTPKRIIEQRLHAKTQRGSLKKMRNKKWEDS